MNVLFLHPAFPGQFRYLAEFFGKDKKNQTIFVTMQTAGKELQIPGVKKIIIAEKSEDGDNGETTPLKSPPGLPVANLLTNLKKQDFVPDIIIGHSGSGMSFYIKDVFPKTPFLSFFDWYHNVDKSQEMEPASEQELKTRINFRNKNMLILNDLVECDMGICPSRWQKKQFPAQFHGKLAVVHEGIDTQLLKPMPDAVFKTEGLDLSDLSGAKQLITYTVNLLAPYKGFDQFIEALPALFESKPDAHVVILGADRITINDVDGNKKSYKTTLLEKTSLDTNRVHFIDTMSYEHYITLLQASNVHVYIDSPMVVSRPLLEAMACECMVIAQNIPPVKEVIKDGSNGILIDFSSAEKVAQKIIDCLEFPSFMEKLKQKARQTIIDDYAIKKSISQQFKAVKRLMQPDNKQDKNQDKKKTKAQSKNTSDRFG